MSPWVDSRTPCHKWVELIGSASNSLNQLSNPQESAFPSAVVSRNTSVNASNKRMRIKLFLSSVFRPTNDQDSSSLCLLLVLMHALVMKVGC